MKISKSSRCERFTTALATRPPPLPRTNREPLQSSNLRLPPSAPASPPLPWRRGGNSGALRVIIHTWEEEKKCLRYGQYKKKKSSTDTWPRLFYCLAPPPRNSHSPSFTDRRIDPMRLSAPLAIRSQFSSTPPSQNLLGWAVAGSLVRG